MSNLFGTDGIRGVANEDLKPTLAYALGRAVAFKLAGPGGRILVGQDTRRSGDMLVAALMAGGTSVGADVHVLGICPTPALAHVTAVGDYDAGVMVSASHNPAEDNGLKVLGGRGLKLDDSMEDELETLIIRSEELGSPRNDDLGRVVDARAAMRHYMEHRMGLARRIGSDLRLHVDCANGSASAVAAQILAASGASVSAHFDDPDGCNINLACGATVTNTLAAIVSAEGGDAGFSLDGDADRCVAIDEHGTVVDGDQLLGIIALDRIARDALAENTVVVSILSNGGLARAVEQAGGRVLRTPVGDRHIVDSMMLSNAGLGGEKSGHVIIREHTTTGDGIVTALEILDILARSGRPLSELAAAIPLDPQEQRTVRVGNKEWRADPALADAVKAAEDELDGSGRIVVRASGTEPALRVMVEGRDPDRVRRLADGLAALATERLNQER
jgi:phosphoglucosamine mutase